MTAVTAADLAAMRAETDEKLAAIMAALAGMSSAPQVAAEPEAKPTSKTGRAAGTRNVKAAADALAERNAKAAQRQAEREAMIERAKAAQLHVKIADSFGITEDGKPFAMAAGAPVRKGTVAIAATHGVDPKNTYGPKGTVEARFSLRDARNGAELHKNMLPRVVADMLAEPLTTLVNTLLNHAEKHAPAE